MEPNILKVFVSPGCYGCQRARNVAQRVKQLKPQLEVRVLDLDSEPDHSSGVVFAVPTYVYNGKALFLGNPSPQELQNWLDSLDLEA